MRSTPRWRASRSTAGTPRSPRSHCCWRPIAPRSRRRSRPRWTGRSSGGSAPAGGTKRRFGASGPRKRRRWSGVWQGGAVAAGVAMIAAIAVVAGGGRGGSSARIVVGRRRRGVRRRDYGPSSSGSGESGSAATASPPVRGAQRRHRRARPRRPLGYELGSAASSTSGAAASGSASSGSVANGSAAGSASVPDLQPPTTGRKVSRVRSSTSPPPRPGSTTWPGDLRRRRSGERDRRELVRDAGWTRRLGQLPAEPAQQRAGADDGPAVVQLAQVVRAPTRRGHHRPVPVRGTRALADARALEPRCSSSLRTPTPPSRSTASTPRSTTPSVDLERSGHDQPPATIRSTTARCTSRSGQDRAARPPRTAAAGSLSAGPPTTPGGS